MKNSLWKMLASNLALSALALTVSCTCLCGAEPGMGSIPSRAPGQAAVQHDGSWRFVVSGDSRNCGDVIMPAIAAGAKAR